MHQEHSLSLIGTRKSGAPLMLIVRLQKPMKWNLKRVLFWWSIMAGIFLGLTFINHLWPINPDQPQHRLNIGLALDIKEFLFAVSAYALVYANRIKPCIAVVLIWIAVKLIYGASVLLFEPFSGFTIVIFVGQLLMAGILAYFISSEIKTIQVASTAT